MKWLKEVLLVLVTKLSSWQAFAICLIGLGGYMGIKFYEKQTERLIATAQIPKAEKVVDWVETKSTLAGVGVENKSSDDKAMMSNDTNN